jgi:hypothetical protein
MRGLEVVIVSKPSRPRVGDVPFCAAACHSSFLHLSVPHTDTAMKLSLALPLAALSAAFVVPDEQVMNQIALEAPQGSILDKLPSKEQVHDAIGGTFPKAGETTKNVFDEVLEGSSELVQTAVEKLEEEYFDVQGWLGSAFTELDEDFASPLPDGKHPHHPPPPHKRPPHHGPHGPHRPHHPHHPHHGHHRSNLTVYEIIAGSKYTTKLAKLIGEYDDLVDLLNGTKANYTIFAPTDKAFAKIPDHAPKPSKEVLKKILTYHVSSDFYPAHRVVASPTIPTLLEGTLLGGLPQRLRTSIGFHGLRINFYSKVVAANIVSLIPYRLVMLLITYSLGLMA